jgi:signal transduction histidine kinase/FixJ family two-component response regulator
MTPIPQKDIDILVIDDDDQIRMLLKSFLSMKGYRVKTYPDGIYAMEDEKLGEYDVVISDLNMPQVDGLTVLTHTKKINSDIVCLIVSGMATLDSAIKALRTGIDDYIVKPFDINQLEMVIERNLRTVRLKNENITLQEEILFERNQLRRTNAELQLINNLILSLEANYNFNKALEAVGEDFRSIVEYDGYFFLNLVKAELTVYTEQIITPVVIEALSNSIDTFFKNHPQYEKDRPQSITYPKASGENGAYQIADQFTFPFRSNEKLVGVLGFFTEKKDAYAQIEESFFTGISDRVQSILDRIEQIVEKQKYLFSTMLDHMNDVVMLVDIDKDFVKINKPARILFEIPSSESTFEKLRSLFNDDWNAIYAACYEENRSYRHRYTIGSDNDKLVFDAVINKFSDPPFIDQGYIISARNITSDMKVEELKADLISNVSHELKTPIAIIKEYVSLMNDEIAGPVTKMQHKFIDIINSNLERLSALIANFLNISKLDAGGLTITISEENINDVVERIVEPFFVRFKTKNMVLTLEVQEAMEKFPTDRDVVQQVLVNLLENSFKYSPNESEVLLHVEINAKGHLYLFVKDNGRGIAKNDQAKVFDRFFRTGLEMERLPGTGLGLSIIKQLIEELGGQIWLESTLGKGSTFFVEIPPNPLPAENFLTEELN